MNPRMFSALDHLLEGARFDHLAEAMTSSLVDSNVFLRAVVLSLHRFVAGANADATDGAAAAASVPSPSGSGGGGAEGGLELIPGLSKCPFKLARFLQARWRRLLWDLMGVVDSADVNQVRARWSPL
eukprot:227636-Prorocentrum_minimum.AAC.1